MELLVTLSADELAWLSSLNVKSIVSVQQFPQALTNQVFLITDKNNQQLVFKRLNLKARNRQYRNQELAVHKLVSERGLSTKILADSGQYRLQTYIKGATLNSTVITDDIIKLFAEQLQTIHQLPAKCAPLQSLGDELIRLKKQLGLSIDNAEFYHFLALARKLDKSSAKDTLCHGDLSFGNILQTENKHIKILDWEYAVLASPAYDLAACCCINAFDSVQQQALIEEYYLLKKDNLSINLQDLQKETALYFSVFFYLNKLWEAHFKCKLL